MNIPTVFAALACAAASVYAVETKTWQQADMADFERGDLTRLSLSSDGRLTLAPALKEIYDPSVTFLWAVARDSKGNVYAGGGGLGGSKAKLVEVDAAGRTKKLAEFDALAVQAIAIDAQDRVYAATSPDGKVYRVDASGNAQVFFDPHAKYIWAMTFAKSGDLYVATGDQGLIYRVTPAGAGSVFFRTEETHARSLAMDAHDNLIVGTDPSGLILRITPAAKSFVLYQAPKREITAVAVAPAGEIYAAGIGAKTVSAPAPSAPAPIPATAPTGLSAAIARSVPAPPPSFGTSPASITGGSEVYRVEADGFTRRVWASAQDVVYAIAFDSHGTPWIGTGNHGAIYRLDSPESYTRLLNVAPTQVTALCSDPNRPGGGRIYAVTGNIGKIVSIGPELETSGNIESDVFDAGAFTYWGRLDHSTGENKSGSIVFETRSGNVNRPQENWSEWARLNAGQITSPAARYLQYRATLSGPSELDEVDAFYQMKNVAPVLDAVEITPANYKFPAPVAPAAATPSALNLPPIGRERSFSSNPAPAPDSGSSPSLTYAKGQIGARWLANDENGDTLCFKLEIRGVNETAWQLLKENLREHYYSWDSTAFPDGKYVLRVTTSDAPSNPPAQALTGSLESDPFLIDNTSPAITALQGAAAGNKIEVTFHAKDGLSTIAKAEYSVNGGDWLMLDPVGRLSDAKEEDYRFSVDRAAGENTIAVRVSDEYDNQTVAKTVVK